MERRVGSSALRLHVRPRIAIGIRPLAEGPTLRSIACRPGVLIGIWRFSDAGRARERVRWSRVAFRRIRGLVVGHVLLAFVGWIAPATGRRAGMPGHHRRAIARGVYVYAGRPQPCRPCPFTNMRPAAVERR
jgi:hypothetical protein